VPHDGVERPIARRKLDANLKALVMVAAPRRESGAIHWAATAAIGTLTVLTSASWITMASASALRTTRLDLSEQAR
jgi:hypothetical protein